MENGSSLSLSPSPSLSSNKPLGRREICWRILFSMKSSHKKWDIYTHTHIILKIKENPKPYFFRQSLKKSLFFLKIFTSHHSENILFDMEKMLYIHTDFIVYTGSFLPKGLLHSFLCMLYILSFALWKFIFRLKKRNYVSFNLKH